MFCRFTHKRLVRKNLSLWRNCNKCGLKHLLKANSDWFKGGLEMAHKGKTIVSYVLWQFWRKIESKFLGKFCTKWASVDCDETFWVSVWNIFTSCAQKMQIRLTDRNNHHQSWEFLRLLTFRLRPVKRRPDCSLRRLWNRCQFSSSVSLIFPRTFCSAWTWSNPRHTHLKRIKGLSERRWSAAVVRAGFYGQVQSTGLSIWSHAGSPFWPKAAANTVFLYLMNIKV